MTPFLRKKYTPEVCKRVCDLFEEDVKAWAKIRLQGELDIQCVSTDTGDSNVVAGPWPEEEWKARHTEGQQRPCLHEDILTPYINQVVNKIEVNPMGVEVQPAGDMSDEKTAEFLEGRIRQWEYENNAQQAYLAAVQNAVTCSYGAWKNEVYYTDGFNRKLCIEAIQNQDSIIPGPWAKPDASDMRRAWELERMTHQKFKEKYPKAKPISFDTMGTQAGQWVDDNSVQVAAWWHLDIDERELLYVDNEDESGNGKEVYADELQEGETPKILNRRKVYTKKVIKTVFNGIEALDETEYIDPGDPKNAVDPEIPIYMVTGRVKFEKGERTLESLVRKGRTGQLLYDFTISAIHETISLTPRVHRLGPEGSFDTTTDWNPRSITAYKEYKPVIDPTTGQVLPAPVTELYNPPIQNLEMAKSSILIGVQNAIGMATVERKDRSAKSGKALEALAEEMTIGTSHYYGDLRVAQERQYRALQRILPVLESKREGMLAIRDRLGNHTMTEPNYGGRHAVTVGAGKQYQNLQEKQAEFASELTKAGGDPSVQLVALAGAAKMKGIGAYGDQLYKIFTRLLVEAHPNLADLFPDSQPEGQNPMQAQQQVQQAQQAIQALNAHSKQLEEHIIELEDEKRAEIHKMQMQMEMNKENNETKLQIATINASTKENVSELQNQVAAMKHISEFLTERFGLAHDADQNAMNRQHEQEMQVSTQDMDMAQQQMDPSHDQDMAESQQEPTE